MSLQLAAKHLEAHGRGDDSHLVHMTTGELGALQKLANAHGGSLTVNPHTGLPEAGFLSSLLPTVAGIGIGMLTGDPLIAAGIVGGADYAITGSLGQGLMAGLGAWGGASFGGDVASFGAAPVTDPSIASSGIPAGIDTTGMTQEQLDNLKALYNTPGTQTASAATGVTNTAANANPFVKGTEGGYSWDQFSSGAKDAFNNPSQFLAQPGAKMATLSAFGGPLMAGLSAVNQPATAPTQSTNSNPMGLKINPPWTGPTVPAQPNPYYQAHYRNYVQNPYNPATESAADGGLMGVNRYADEGMTTDDSEPQISASQKYNAIQDIQKGAAMMSTPKPEMSSYHASFHTDPGVYLLNNTDYANTNPLALMSKSHVKQAAGLSPVMTLGDITTDPAMVAQQQIEQQQQRPVAVKEGGLMEPINYASGGQTSNTNTASPVNYLVPNSGIYNGTSNNSSMMGKGKGTPSYAQYGYGSTQTPDGYVLNPNFHPGALPSQYNPMSTSQFIKSPQSFAQMMTAKGKGSPAKATVNTPTPTPAPAVVDNHIYIPQYAHGGNVDYSMGGLGSLGSYSDGGQLLKGPGDGVSDSIPASIGEHQPARLAEGEFVVPARIVSELGNGSTDAGAKRLYAMMDRIKEKRAKTKDIAADTKAYKYLPA